METWIFILLLILIALTGINLFRKSNTDDSQSKEKIIDLEKNLSAKNQESADLEKKNDK